MTKILHFTVEPTLILERMLSFVIQVGSGSQLYCVFVTVSLSSLGAKIKMCQSVFISYSFNFGCARFGELPFWSAGVLLKEVTPVRTCFDTKMPGLIFNTKGMCLPMNWVCKLITFVLKWC